MAKESTGNVEGGIMHKKRPKMLLKRPIREN